MGNIGIDDEVESGCNGGDFGWDGNIEDYGDFFVRVCFSGNYLMNGALL